MTVREGAFSGDSPHRTDTDALATAAEWFVLLASGEASADDRQRWLAWRSVHPANEAAWRCAELSVSPLAAVPNEQAKASSLALQRVAEKKTTRPPVKSTIFGLTIGTVILCGWHTYLHSDWSADVVTAIGERREIRLSDGSMMQLDTDTAVDLDYSAAQRFIRLRRGRILVETATDPAPKHRPLAVETTSGRATALGTRFTVAIEDSDTQIVVLKDRVAVSTHDTPATSTVVGTGELLRYSAHGKREVTKATANESAWSTGRLVADNLTLIDFTRRLARYVDVPLECTDSVAGLRLSGVFPLDSPERTLGAIATTLPVIIERHRDRIVLTTSQKNNGFAAVPFPVSIGKEM